MRPRELLMTALTFFLVAVGFGLGIRTWALSRAQEELRSAFVFLSTLRRSDEAELIDRVYSGDSEAMQRSCQDLAHIRPELLQVCLYGPTFQPLAGVGKIDGEVAPQEIEALAAHWVQQAEAAEDTAHGFVAELESGRRLVYLAPLRAAGQPLAYLRVDYDLSAIDGGRQQMVVTVVIAVLTTLAVHVALLSWVRRKKVPRQRA